MLCLFLQQYDQYEYASTGFDDLWSMICGRLFEMLISVRARYKRGQVKIQRPEFYTFYNGEDISEKERILKLSDAFIDNESNSKAPSVELIVRVININPAAHHEILDKCPVLREYGQFIDTIRKYQKNGYKEPYKRAIQECMNNGILAEYLRRRGSEVENMLMTEYDYKTDIEVQREEAEQHGIEIGEQRAIASKNLDSIRKLYKKGWSVSDIAEFVEMPEQKVEEIIQQG